METNPTAPPGESSAVLQGRTTNWLVFFAVLFIPPILTVLALLLGAKQGGTAPVIAVFGGGLSGIICDTILGRRFGNTAATKIVLGLIFALVLGAACIGMGCFGCVAGGYQLDVR